MALLLALLLSTAFPSTSRTSWMRPESFHLTIGMSRVEALEALEKWAPKPGKDADEVVMGQEYDRKGDVLHAARTLCIPLRDATPGAPENAWTP